VNEIRVEYVSKNSLFFSSAAFRTIAHRRGQEFGIPPGRLPFSSNFIHNFKKLHLPSSPPFLSSPPFHFCVDNYRIGNCDDGAWRAVANGTLTADPLDAHTLSVELKSPGKETITVFVLQTRISALTMRMRSCLDCDSQS
jgi:hypothetical protein